MATPKQPVLITGGAGLIGRLLIDRLPAHYALTSFDLHAVPGLPSVVGTLTDFPAVLHACQGQDTVIHLAADPRVDSPWGSNLSTNIVGTYHVFEAARQAGVRRVVVASSQHATGGFYLEEPYKAITEGRYQEVPLSYVLLDERPAPSGRMATTARPRPLARRWGVITGTTTGCPPSTSGSVGCSRPMTLPVPRWR
jgi:nucleoside-diphosphate-sugar epimerase